ncbi:MAG: FAD binding domain-containing protein [Longimicrobiales bacterium]|nr:FAD binding domain-containing protein [Longimicrobiales bacterium]
MLRLPSYRYHRPRSLPEALALKAEHGENALYIAGGTDLVPNMKHRLFEPGHLIGLKGVPELSGIAREKDYIRIGAAETLADVASHELVRSGFPALAEAAAHVAGPQLRNAGTIGGNVCLDTRCTYYNQTAFWRRALGFCLKKDGDVCHVTKVGRKCVAAHSADTPPVLMTLDAALVLAGPAGERSLPVRDFFVADGISNSRRASDEILKEIRVPVAAATRRQGYVKLRQRKSIDFPLLTIAVAADLDEDGTVRALDGVVTGLGSRPRELTGWDEIAEGRRLDDQVVDALAERAHRQCHPLENIIVDPEWRRAMVPVYVKRALAQVRAA